MPGCAPDKPTTSILTRYAFASATKYFCTPTAQDFVQCKNGDMYLLPNAMACRAFC